MENKKTLTQARLVEMFHYSKETGVFVRKVPVLCSNGQIPYKAGAIAGSVGSNGYINISVDGRKYYAHQLAFLYVTGSFPLFVVDHIDGTRSNNAWSNLRDVTHKENLQNRKRLNKSNKSTGLLGVSKYGKHGKYKAGIVVDNKRIHLGVFDNKEDAFECYAAAKKYLHAGSTI